MKMNNVLVFISGLLGGFALCWGLFRLSPLPGQVAVTPPISLEQQEERLFSNDAQAPTLAKVAVNLIQIEQVDAAMDLLHQLTPDTLAYQQTYQQLLQHLNTLHQQERWEQLHSWVEALLANGFSEPVLFQLKAAIHGHYGQYVEAIQALYTVKYLSVSSKLIGEASDQIDTLVTSLVNRYVQNDLLLSRPDVLDVLAFAWEKQPDHPPIGLAYARFYEKEKHYDKAISVLELIPYSADYGDEVVKNLSELRALQQSISPKETMASDSIPLVRRGNQYIVEVLVNEGTPLKLLLDTGANVSALSLPVFNRLVNTPGVKRTGRQVRLNTANGSTLSEVYQVDSVWLGEYQFMDVAFFSIDMGDSDKADGLLGMDILSRFKFEINQSESRLYLTPHE